MVSEMGMRHLANKTKTICCMCFYYCIFFREKLTLKLQHYLYSSYIILPSFQDSSCLLFTHTALCWPDLNTTLVLWICWSSLCFVFWRLGGAFWSFGAVLWNVSCFICRLFCVSCSSLQAVVERANGGEIDKWGQEERTLRRVSLSCSEFNANMDWKDSSSLRHSNSAERHNDISIGQEREREGKGKEWE